ncbi:MAG: hypothetical protein AABM43_03915 [Actinomycetota bacterium]
MGLVSVAVACALPASAHAAVLYDQNNFDAGSVSLSDDFSVDTYDSQTADDFTVPVAQSDPEAPSA